MSEDYVSRVFTLENAIPPETCREIVDFAQGKELKQATIGQGHLHKNIRDTHHVNTHGILERLNRIVADLIIRHIEPFFGMEVHCWEKPELLMYLEGGKYEQHLDGEVMVKQDDGSYEWKRFIARDISILLYLNEDFTGGGLTFPKIGVKIQPKPGLLVAFPSGRPYLHKAETVESGYRLVIVTWATCPSVGPMRKNPPANTAYMKDYR